MMKCEEKNKISIMVIIFLGILLGTSIYYAYNLNKDYENSKLNDYNEAFCNLVDYMNSVESLLAKSTISRDAKYSAETLTEIWKDSNLALVYLSRIPLEMENISQTAKFLNQVSDYSYTLSRKNISNEELTNEELDNLYTLHQYCVNLESSLNQLSEEIYTGTISWDDLDIKKDLDYVQAVDNISFFSNIDANFDEYEGLIYDGAYSDHVNKAEKVGLIGEEISEDEAYQKVKDFFGEDKIEKITLNNLLKNANIECYDFSVELKEEESDINIEITKIGGFVLEMQNNRDVDEEKISIDEANLIGKDFLEQKGFESMEPTYFTKLSNIITVNYAYEYNDIIAYSDLIKVKMALDNGEILGIETEGYLNSHTDREFHNVNFSIDQAREKINPNLEILSEKIAVIPTKWKTEILCYEFKGRVDDRQFLIYINTETGEEEDILVILDTPGGILTI